MKRDCPQNKNQRQVRNITEEPIDVPPPRPNRQKFEATPEEDTMEEVMHVTASGKPSSWSQEDADEVTANYMEDIDELYPMSKPDTSTLNTLFDYYSVFNVHESKNQFKICSVDVLLPIEAGFEVLALLDSGAETSLVDQKTYFAVCSDQENFLSPPL